MHRWCCWVSVVAIALIAAGCSEGESSTTSTTTTTSTTPVTTTLPTTTTTTTVPEPECDAGDVLATVDAATASARLAPGGDWLTDTAGIRFAERTATGDEFADRLGLDCGLTAGQAIGDDERLVIMAWTGPRIAWVIQTTEVPSMPYAHQATVTVLIDVTEGEFLDGDRRALWAGTFDSGETFVIGHVDYNLGAAAKDWIAGPRTPIDEEINLKAEQHGVDTLAAAGMRNIGIAQPPEIGSEEGYLQFVSPTGQISVAVIGPDGWFNPLEPRYFSGPTRVETISGVDIRVTEPGPADGENAIGADVGFACGDFVWLLEPPFNGDTDEMLASASAIVGTAQCAPEE